jgi:signal transduction histidine kinase
MRIRTPRLSLERKLPVLIFGLLLAVVAAQTWSAYREVRSAAESQALERLRRVSAQLAASTRTTLTRRGVLERRVASDAAVVAFLLAPTDADRAREARQALRQLTPPGDSVTVAELWASRGSRLLTTAPHLPPETGEALALTARMRDDSARFGRFYRSRDSTFFWSGAPVRRGTATLGYVLERRKLAGDSAADRRARDLIGSDVRLYFTSERGEFWNAITGVPAAAPPSSDTLAGAPDLVTYVRDGRERFIARREPVLGASLSLLVEQPYAVVLERPAAFLRRNGLVALCVLLLGTVVASIISRRLVRPLTELDAAAEALRAGAYGRRVQSGRLDEVGRLARTFNAMAESIERAQAELEQRVRESGDIAQRLDAANRAKSDFLAVMSHELRTPLNAIAGYVDLLELGLHGPLTEEQRRALERVRENQQQLLRSITSILDFTRVEAQEMRYDPRATQLGDAVHDIERRLEGELRGKRLRYRCEGCSDDIVAFADPARLHEVLFHLLANSIRFTPMGGEITISLDESVDMARIRVRDTGVGIPRERLEAVFEPFVQAKTGLTRPASGAGLGLTLSREYARGMGGDLTVESTEGVGTTFTLFLRTRTTAVRDLAS